MMDKKLPIKSVDVIKHTIAVGIIKEVLRSLDVSSDNLLIVSSISNIKNNESTTNDMRGKNQKDIIVNASYNVEIHGENNATFRTRSNYNTPLFYDKDNFSIIPINIGSRLTAAIMIETKSKSDINTIINKIKLLSRENQTHNTHTLTYRHTIEPEVLAFMYTLYKLKKESVGDDETFITFLEERCMKKLTWVDNISGSDAQISVVDKVSNCLGGYTDRYLKLKPSFDSETGKYMIAIEYELFIDIPTFLHIKYFITYYNKQLPKVFLNTGKRYTLPTIEENAALASSADITPNLLERYSIETYIHDRYVHIPTLDIYNEFETIGAPICSILALVDKEKDLLFNFGELGGFSINRFYLKFLKYSEYPYVTKDYMSFLSLTLYEDNIRIPEGILMDESLNVYLTRPFDNKKRYRVLFSIILDKDLLDPDAIERLKEFVEDNEPIIDDIIRDQIGPIIIDDDEINDFYRLGPIDLPWDVFLYKLIEGEGCKGGERIYDINLLTLEIRKIVQYFLDNYIDDEATMEYVDVNNGNACIVMSNGEVGYLRTLPNNRWYIIYKNTIIFKDSVRIVYVDRIIYVYVDGEIVKECTNITECIDDNLLIGFIRPPSTGPIPRPPFGPGAMPINRPSDDDNKHKDGSPFKTVLYSTVIAKSLYLKG